jgi:hypothetical protein
MMIACALLMLVSRLEFIARHGWTWSEPIYLANWCFVCAGFIVSRRGLLALRALPSAQLFSEATFPAPVLRREALWLRSAAVISALAIVAALKEPSGRVFNVAVAAMFGGIALSGVNRWRRTSSA